MRPSSPRQTPDVPSIVLPPVLAVGKRLGKFGKRDGIREEPKRDAKVVQNQALKEITVAWEKFLVSEFTGNVAQEGYELALKTVSDAKLEYDAADVTSFSLTLAKYEGYEQVGERAGIFLSALVNAGKDKEYTIYADQIQIFYLGTYNSKDLTIIGNCGGGLATEMVGGSITVNGNCNDIGNFIRSGQITVNGYVRLVTTVGFWSSKTPVTIIINGDADEIRSVRFGVVSVRNVRSVFALAGGEVRIEGECGNCNPKDGRVFIKGQLIEGSITN